MSAKETQVAVIDAKNFALMQVDPSEIAEVFAENLGGDSLRMTDLTTIHIPAGGSLAWSIPTIDGETTTANLQGVVVAHKNVRRYYKEDFATSGGGTAPDCKSEDGIHGQGECASQCGGLCSNCPMSQFTKNEKGDWNSTPCKQYTLVFLVREDAILPSVLVVAPTSIRAFSDYKRALATQKMKRLSAVISEFTLSREKSATGINYSKMAVKPIQYLDKDLQVQFRDFGLKMEQFLNTYVAPDNLDGFTVAGTEVLEKAKGETGGECEGFTEADIDEMDVDNIPFVE